MAESSKSTTYENTDLTERIQPRNHFFDREEINLESHQLVWCDVQAKATSDKETIEMAEKLRKIVDYTQFFDDVKECERYLKDTTDMVTFLICSDEFGKTLNIHYHQREIYSIYVFCQNDKEHSHWSKEESMVGMIYTNYEELLKHLETDVQTYLGKEKHGLFNELDRSEITAQLSLEAHWPIIVESLCYLSYPDDCRANLVASLRHYYQNRIQTLAALTEFEQEYTSSAAIHWYTRDTVLFRLLNRALRQQNTQLLLLFGFFLRDLFFQLTEEYHKFKSFHSITPIITVYRGQLISLKELRSLKEPNEIGALGLMITNSFFSSTLNRNSALIFLNQTARPEDEEQSVLFEIEIDFRKESSHPFADISQLSHFSSEQEILFMPGTYFGVSKITYSTEEGIYIIKLNLSAQIKSKFNNLCQRRLLKKCSDRLADYLSDETSNEIDGGFDALTCLFPSEEQWLLAAKYQCLGQSYHWDIHLPDLQKALSHYSQALQIWENFLTDRDLNCSVNIGDIHESLGGLYREHYQDYCLANKHYDLSVNSCKTALTNKEHDYEERKYLLRMISRVYEQKMEISGDDVEQRRQNCLKAIKVGRLEFQEMVRNSDSCMVTEAASCIHRVGTLEESICMHDEALISYNEALQIYDRQYHTPLRDTIAIYDRMAKIYLEHKKDEDLGLKYALMKHENVLQTQKVDANAGAMLTAFVKSILAESYLELADVYIKLYQTEQAWTNLRMAKQLYAESNYPYIEEAIKRIEEKLTAIGTV